MPSPRKQSPFRLLVEGRDDEHTVIHLMARHGYDWADGSRDRPYIRDCGGIDSLLDELPVALLTYRCLGVVLDANQNLPKRWLKVKSSAARQGLDLPPYPHKEGTILDGRLPGSRVGFWLMPDNSSPGALEDFLHRLVPADDPCWSFAGEVVPEARKRGARCRENDHLKSALHTWLAWQEEPGQPFGVALKAKFFAHESEDARRFVAWFRRLFVDE